VIATFLSQPEVIGTSWIEVLGVVLIVGYIVGAYRHIECHKHGCHRLGRFVHGHYKLCARHHPNVPSDGKVTAAHIERI
jgi:hypothetical protein